MKKYFCYFLGFTITSCSLFDNPEDGKISLLDVTDEPAGANCSIGGLKISVGIDNNRNGTLDNIEISSTKYICNGQNGTIGSNGLNSVISTVAVPVGNICENGGVQINSGLDTDRDNVLDDIEIQSSKYVCNGVNGLYDKQILIKLTEGISNYYNGTAMETTYRETDLVQFNINDYMVDSVGYIAYDLMTLVGYDGNFQKIDHIGNLTLTLVDKANGQIILGSEIVSDDIPTGTFKGSKNLKTTFPNQRIDLKIKLTSDLGKLASVGKVYLVMYRK